MVIILSLCLAFDIFMGLICFDKENHIMSHLYAAAAGFLLVAIIVNIL